MNYALPRDATAVLTFEVISTENDRASVIVTANLRFEQWSKVLQSKRLTAATLDRLTHRCSIAETGGESYRLREAQRRRRGKPSKSGFQDIDDAESPK